MMCFVLEKVFFFGNCDPEGVLAMMEHNADDT